MSVSSGGGHQRKCAIGWKYFDHTGFCYKYFPFNARWDEARENCRKEAADGGELTDVPDMSTKQFIFNLTERRRLIKNQEDGRGLWVMSDKTLPSNQTLEKYPR